ncbi:MAG: 4-alpha-glucanotransferase [Dysgonamonadaceae bacterium]
MITLNYRLNYSTVWGQRVYICGSVPELGSFDEDKAKELVYTGNSWTIEVKVKDTTFVQYYYFIKNENYIERREWGGNRFLNIDGSKTFIINDQWRDKPYHHYLYSSAFTKTIFHHTPSQHSENYFQRSVVLNIVCPYVSAVQTLMMVGDNDYLSNWDSSHGVELNFMRRGEWQIVLNAEQLPEVSQYKFFIADKKTKQVVHWEDGGNRFLFTTELNGSTEGVFVEMGLQFQYLGFQYKGAGVSVPVFSLRSEQSFGIGDFNDLKKLVDWTAITGQKLIQILPVNDTTTTRTWRDSYPYSAISIYALHPIYLGLTDYPLKDVASMKKYQDEAVALNSLEKVDYDRVLDLKYRYLQDLFKQEGAKVLKTSEYQSFYADNKSWIFPYSCYCYLRNKNKTAKFLDWGEFAVYDETRLTRMLDIYPDAIYVINFYGYVQYLLHNQLSGVKNYAHKQGIALKGDIPIGINRDSIDAWTNPGLFNMDTQTGVPPDDFSIFGQNWGFPTYNWSAMKRENYVWWKERFKKMSDYFDAYRIDHILGFFRIWEIPVESVQGLLGHFSPALPYWAEEIVNAGIPFDEDRMTKPFIHEGFLNEYFGEFTDEVKDLYLEVSGWQQFRLKSFCDTQQKIKALFNGQDDTKINRLRDGLYGLCNEVLFVRDRQDAYRFHPRITAQYSYSYKYLDDNVKEAFNRLYDDFFYHRHNYYWREQAMSKLPELISSTSMLVCGEDLGMVPDCVPSVMNELQILSLEIQRMPKDSHLEFADLTKVPYLSVCTPSTHDMSPIRGWWKENRETTQHYYNYILGRWGEAPEVCSTDLCIDILYQHLNSSAMWVIIPLQDWMSIDNELSKRDPDEERINIPSNPDHYWRYRMHVSLEKLLEEKEFNRKVLSMSSR